MLQLFNSLTKKKESFEPLDKNEVGLYTCGLTVYNYAHIGNLRTYLFEDVLKRVLIYNDYKVKHVMNITDVGHLTSDADEGEDKMEKSAVLEGKTAWEIAEFYTKEFKQDLSDLNITEPNIWCKATDHIQEQIDWIVKLEKKGFTYKTSDGIYFDTSKLPDYGKLTGQRLDQLKEGARVEKNKEKKNPTDFALWKFSTKGKQRQMEWESPWGIGFPGWHIECSVMAQKYLGDTFDIHCGGIDHIAVHHTNEIAQAEAVTGKQFVKYWLHGDFLVIPGKALLKDGAGFLNADQVGHEKLNVPGTNAPINNTKMSKSAGNFITVRTIKEKNINPLAYRFFNLSAHYRSKLNFSWEALEAAQNGLENLYALVGELGEPKIGCAEFEGWFMDAINDDLNIPKALALTWDLLKSDYPPEAKKASVLKFDEVLGLDLKNAKPIKIPDSIRDLVNKREGLRQKKQFDDADKLRDEIASSGFSVDDSPAGPVIKQKK